MYKNPVLNRIGIDQGDPAVLEFEGTYFLYHTGGHSVSVYRSTDLVNWLYLGEALYASDKPGHWAGIDLWAPEVIYAQGRFYMYVAGAKRVDGKGDDGVRRIGVAIAECPEGPFILQDSPLTDEWSIDAHPFLDSDGTWYMFYNVRNSYTRGPSNVIGCGNVVDKMTDFLTLEGHPSFVCKPEFAWEGDLEGSWYWNEGSFTIKRLGKYYQMYSGGCYYQPTYHLGVAISDVCRGPNGMDDRSWEKWPNGTSIPILKSNDQVWGPGHHVVAMGPNGVHLYAVYHGHVGDDPTRTTYIDHLYWRGDCLYIQGPTAHQKPGPFRPSIWQPELLVDGERFVSGEEDCYLFEGWVTLDEPIEFVLAHNAHGKETTWRLEGADRQLPSKVVHKWRIIKDGPKYACFLDGVLVYSGDQGLTTGSVGIRCLSPHTFKGVRLTRYFSEVFTPQLQGNCSSSLVVHTVRDDIDGWEMASGQFALASSGGLTGSKGTNVAIRSHHFAQFEFSTSVSGADKAGLIPVYHSEGSLVVALSMPERTVEVLAGESCLFKQFIPDDAWNEYGAQHLQIRVLDSGLLILCNGWIVRHIPCPIEHSNQVGIYSEGQGKLDTIELIELIEEGR